MLLHLIDAEDWAWLEGADRYAPPSLDTEGFVHCSPDDPTMLAVANRFYREHGGELLVLTIDEQALSSPVRWEAPAHPDGSTPATGEAVFPHVYGPIELAAVRDVRRLTRDPAGDFSSID